MKTLDVVSYVLLIIGGLNWGLVGLADFDLVAFLFGTTALATIVYLLVGLAAVYEIALMKPICGRWGIHLHKPAHP